MKDIIDIIDIIELKKLKETEKQDWEKVRRQHEDILIKISNGERDGYVEQIKELEKELHYLWSDIWDNFYIARLSSRYLVPIQRIVKNDKFEGEGFSIVTILCSMVEMLESFELGVKYNHKCSKKTLGPDEYSNSGMMYSSFFCNRKPFSVEFKNDKEKAEAIYTSIRCGLLHEAQTKNGWRILADSDSIICFDFEEKIIYRNNFSHSFYEYLEDYKERLISNRDLQINFIKRMNSLFE